MSRSPRVRSRPNTPQNRSKEGSPERRKEVVDQLDRLNDIMQSVMDKYATELQNTSIQSIESEDLSWHDSSVDEQSYRNHPEIQKRVSPWQSFHEDDQYICTEPAKEKLYMMLEDVRSYQLERASRIVECSFQELAQLAQLCLECIVNNHNYINFPSMSIAFKVTDNTPLDDLGWVVGPEVYKHMDLSAHQKSRTYAQDLQKKIGNLAAQIQETRPEPEVERAAPPSPEQVSSPSLIRKRKTNFQAFNVDTLYQTISRPMFSFDEDNQRQTNFLQEIDYIKNRITRAKKKHVSTFHRDKVASKNAVLVDSLQNKLSLLESNNAVAEANERSKRFSRLQSAFSRSAIHSARVSRHASVEPTPRDNSPDTQSKKVCFMPAETEVLNEDNFEAQIGLDSDGESQDGLHMVPVC